MLDYADTSTADALVQYDSVGDINTRGLTATGTIYPDTLNVANNTILNSSKLNGIAGSSNAYQVLTTVSASIDPLVIGSDLQTNTPNDHCELKVTKAPASASHIRISPASVEYLIEQDN